MSDDDYEPPLTPDSIARQVGLTPSVQPRAGLGLYIGVSRLSL
jgi:hypothetical protein